MVDKQITVLGVGNILYTDEGFGVRVIEKLYDTYDFPENISIVDGGVLGMNLLGIITEADHLIVVDAIRNNGPTGSFYRLEGDDIPLRIRAKNSLHQIDLLEALTYSQTIEKWPETVIVGVEPEDIETLSVELTPTLLEKIDPMILMVLKELDRLGVSYRKKESN